jgi:hypothetical protein
MAIVELTSYVAVCQHLQRQGRDVRTALGGALATFTFAHAGSSVELAMRELDAAPSGRWLALSVSLGGADRVSPRGALAASGRLPVGVLAIFDGRLLLRQTLPLSTLSADLLEETLYDLAATSLELRLAAASREDDDDDVPWGYVYR